MTVPRRPTAALALVAIWLTALALVAAAPSAQADAVRRDAPHDPATYYTGTNGLSGTALAARLHTIIAGHTALTYAQLWNALPVTDADPANSSNVLDFYSGTSLLGTAKCNHSGTCLAGEWNREHSWAKSHGDFDTVTGPGTDLFHLRPELADVNSTRGNLDFDNGGTASVTNCAPCTKDGDSFSPRANIRGDVARGLLYMAVRYDGGDGFPDLTVNDYTCNAGSKAPNHGKLSTLVAWSLADPPDALETARNDIVDGTFQHNRNPFIDHPEWVTAIWGNGVGQGPACGVTGGGGTTNPPSNLVISEIYLNGGSSGSAYRTNFVEVYNPLSTTVDLSPYSLQYRPATATGVATARYDFGAGARVAPLHYVVLKLGGGNATTGAALPQVDADATGVAGLVPATTGGTLFLAGTHTSVAPDDDTVRDLLGYGDSNTPEGSAAAAATATTSLQRTAANSDNDTNSTDFAAISPVTPGTARGGAGGHPTVTPMTATTAQNTPVTTALSGSDVYGDPLTWSVAAQPASGSVSISGANATYTPTATFTGTAVATVTAADTHGGSSSTTLSIDVTSANHPPTTSPMAVTTPEDVAATIALTASDPDSDSLTWSINTPPAHGSADVSGSTLHYVPAPDFNGVDQIAVGVSDGHGGSAATAVTVTVSPVNDPPTAVQLDGVAVTKNGTKQITLAGTDVDGDEVSFVIASQPGHGSVTLSGATAAYTPAAGYVGDDSFTYRAKDPSGAQSAPTTVSLSVTPSPRAPTAAAVTASTSEDHATTFTLTASDPDGDALTYAITGQPSHGSLTLTGDQATYTPESDFHGSDSFTWSVTDGTSTVASSATITVTSVNDLPVAAAATLTTTEDTATSVGLTGSDADGDALSFAVASQPAHGTVTLDGSTATYVPAANFHGSDALTFTASDGSATSAPATVSITVTPVNDAPVAAPAAASTAEDTVTTLSLTASDVDGDSLTYAIQTQPGHGSVTLNGALATYTPAGDFNGSDAFTWRVSDGTATTTGSASLTVRAVNDAPTAGALSADTDEDGSGVTISLVGGDVDGDDLAFALDTAAGHGTVVVAGSTATYAPEAGWFGTDTFAYTASDGVLSSSPATVTVTVRHVNHAPVLTATSVTTTAGTPVTVTLAPTDADDDPLTISNVTTPGHGSVSHSGLSLTYTPRTRSGTELFFVTVSDRHGGTATAQIGVSMRARVALLGVFTRPATRGASVSTTITATGVNGPNPSGAVRLTDGATTLGAATLRPDGTATVVWRPPAAGVAHLVAAYAGDRLFDPATSARTSVPVARSTARLTISASPLRRGRGGIVRVAVATVAGVRANGKATLKVGSTTLRARLTHGVATFRIASLPSSERLAVKATYGGNGQYTGASRVATFRIKP